jgi:hypothetical protein
MVSGGSRQKELPVSRPLNINPGFIDNGRQDSDDAAQMEMNRQSSFMTGGCPWRCGELKFKLKFP